MRSVAADAGNGSAKYRVLVHPASMAVAMMMVMPMMFVPGLSGSATQTQADGQSRCENDFAH